MVPVRFKMEGVAGIKTLQHFLLTHKLPADHLTDVKSFYLGLKDDTGQLIASGGREFYAPYALLRSVTVEVRHRCKGYARRLVLDLLAHANEHGVEVVYLLTETAEIYFSKMSFIRISRNEVPAPVRLSCEFTQACPDTSPV